MGVVLLHGVRAGHAWVCLHVLPGLTHWFWRWCCRCGHCKNLKPAWEEAAKDLAGTAKVGAVDCTAHQSVCSQYGVQGYPTIKVFGQNKHQPQDYQGGRDSGSIVAFARQVSRHGTCAAAVLVQRPMAPRKATLWSLCAGELAWLPYAAQCQAAAACGGLK